MGLKGTKDVYVPPKLSSSVLKGLKLGRAAQAQSRSPAQTAARAGTKGNPAYDLPVGSDAWYEYLNLNPEKTPWYYYPIGSESYYQTANKQTGAPLPPSGSDDRGGDDRGGGGGGGGEPAPVAWREGYNVEGAPSWWKGYVPDSWNPESEYMSLLNSMVPFLSSEDQQAVGMNLAQMGPSFEQYGVGTMPPPADMAPGAVQNFYGGQRANSILSALDNMAKASGRKKEDWGPGRKFFEQIAQTLGSYSAGQGEGMSRAKYRSLLGILDPLISGASGGALSPYANIAKMLTQPFFGGGKLQDVIMGSANAKYF